MAVEDVERVPSGKKVEQAFDDLAGAEADAGYERYKTKSYLSR